MDDEENLRELVEIQARHVRQLSSDARYYAVEWGDWSAVDHYWRSIANAAKLLAWAAKELHRMRRERPLMCD